MVDMTPTTDPWMHKLLLVFLLAAADGLLPTTVRAETRAAAVLTPEAVWEGIQRRQGRGHGATSCGDGGVAARLELQALGEDQSDHHTRCRKRQDDHPHGYNHGPWRQGIRAEWSGRKTLPDHRDYLRWNRIPHRGNVGWRGRDQRELQELPRGPLQVPEWQSRSPGRPDRRKATQPWVSRAGQRMPTETVCSSRRPATLGTTRLMGPR